jgi:glucosyltransferase
MELISLIVPAHNEREALPHFYAEISRVAEGMPEVDFEFLFVDDGSTDGTLDEIKKLRAADPRARFVSFSRNFGKEAAIYAGLQHARGDYVAVLDADLQDPPSLLPSMYRAVTEGGFDTAAARRISRDGEGRFRSWCSDRFYGVYNALTRTALVSGARDFRLMRRQVVDAVLRLAEVNRFSKGIFSWVGFRTTWVEYPNVPRVAGTTKWSLLQLLSYSIEGIIDFSTAPLAIASTVGLFFCVLAFGGAAAIFVRALVWRDPVPGWPSIACIVLFASGLQLFTIGLAGQYIARAYLEAKRRPVYLVRESGD